MNEILNFLSALLQAVIIAAVPIVTAFGCSFLLSRKNQISQAARTETGKRLLEEAMDAVAKAVACTNQTYVDTLKKSGKFTSENQREAFLKAFDTAKMLMTGEAIRYIQEAYGSLTTWLTAQIEAEVREQKEHFLETGEAIAEEVFDYSGLGD